MKTLTHHKISVDIHEILLQADGDMRAFTKEVKLYCRIERIPFILGLRPGSGYNMPQGQHVIGMGNGGGMLGGPISRYTSIISHGENTQIAMDEE